VDRDLRSRLAWAHSRDPPHPHLPDLAHLRLHDRLCGVLHDDRLLVPALLGDAVIRFLALLWREQIAPRLRPKTVGQARRWVLYLGIVFWIAVVTYVWRILQ